MAQEGSLVSYGIEATDLYRGAASYVDRILKGAILPIYRLNSRGPPTATTFILVTEDRAKTSSAECSRLGEAGPLF